MITKEKVYKQLKKVIDPELNVNIVDMGLIYGVKIVPINNNYSSRELSKATNREVLDLARTINYKVHIKMTLTTPGCPLSYVFDEWVKDAVKKVKGVKNVTIDLVWEPAWNPDMMSEEAREKIGVLE